MCLAIPGKILRIEGEDPMTKRAKVSFGGILKDANLACVPDARVGDYVLVHVGFAISVVDAAEAEKTFSYLKEIDGLKELRHES